MVEKILVEENQFVRYKRAKEIIAGDGLTVNYGLIEKNYDKIWQDSAIRVINCFNALLIQ